MEKVTGKQLSEKYGLQVRQSWYRENGMWYHNATLFPCAFHDREGVVIVRDQEHWQELHVEPEDGSTYFKVTKETHVDEPGIKGMREYELHESIGQVTPTPPGVSDEHFFQGPDEITPGEYREGATRQVTVNAYERDPAARQACIARYGCSCIVCGFSFGERYGEKGAGYIHVHHLKPLSQIGEDYKVNPTEDMRPLCPNCHAMAHRRHPRPYTINELKSMLAGR